MPITRIRLTQSQLADLEAVCSVGPSVLERIAAALTDSGGLLRPAQLQAIVARETDNETAKTFRRVLLGLATASRRAFVTIPDLLDDVGQSVAGRSGEASSKWTECRSSLELILNSTAMTLTAKAIDLVIDFEKLYLRGRLVTDIRPVFNDSRGAIVGAAITQTLRIDYMTHDGDEVSVALALDNKDVAQLKEECDRALRKGEVTNKMMEPIVPTIIAGEEYDE